MDDSDRYRAGQALESTPSQQTSSWENPDTGNRYEVTPTRTYYDDTRPCREYTTEAWIDGRRETVRGTACRLDDGTWQASN
jgi:surface antigen